MAQKRNPNAAAGVTRPVTGRRLPVTTDTGVNATGTKTVLIGALLEVTGQIRFGDGTDIATTITEKDAVLAPDGKSVEKAIWAGTKRRGVDRRTIHELRDRSGWDGRCFIPELCTECPICWLFGFTGTTLKKDINAKSRVLYATSVSIEDTSKCLNRHSRNQVNEKSQTTTGASGIHEEEVIIAGTHFPIYTSLLHVLDWEIGVVAHAFLENLNANRYTAASRGQGGIRFAERNDEPALVVDESAVGVFPLPVPKLPSWQTEFAKAIGLFAPGRQSTISILPLQFLLQRQGFAVEGGPNKFTAKAGSVELLIESNENFLVIHQGPDELMKRYYGDQALGYLKQRQVEAQKKLAGLRSEGFGKDVAPYIDAIRPKKGGAGGADGGTQPPETVSEEDNRGPGGDEPVNA